MPAGQAQKELFVNEAHARADMLLHAGVRGIADQPPASPSPGECWIVGPTPTGAWSGHPGKLASWQAGNWLFAEAVEGMAVFDEAAGQTRYFRGSWQLAAPVAAPVGGATVDAEARSAVSGLIAALVAGGILPPAG